MATCWICSAPTSQFIAEYEAITPFNRNPTQTPGQATAQWVVQPENLSQTSKNKKKEQEYWGPLTTGSKRHGSQDDAFADNASDIGDDFSDGAVEHHVPTLAASKPSHLPPDSAPVTAAVLKELLVGLQHTLKANKAQICQDLRGLTGSMGTLEQDTCQNAQQTLLLQQTIQELKQQ
ncbi:Hypothetical predicted protein [Pelobates cultripes]|uniref:Uncharacterized protein n=1 Tax=Pelobates cultripes TaxID=61616 RepID=A0AAD1W0A7_PELCU|nr:Hypothetical predicted protein [Pelobates cultripes]